MGEGNIYFIESKLLPHIQFQTSEWFRTNFLYIYVIMWDSMDMICIVLKKTILGNFFRSCCSEKKITDITVPKK